MVVKQPNILTRCVAAIGLSIRSKLLIAFMGITGLLVALSLFGLYSLQQSHARTQALIRDQERIEYFTQIHAYVGDLIAMTVGQYTPYGLNNAGSGGFFGAPVDARVGDLQLFVAKGVRHFGQAGMQDADLVARLRFELAVLRPHAIEVQRLRREEGKPVAAPYAMEKLFEPLRSIQRDVYTVVQGIERDMAAKARSTAVAYQTSRQLVVTSAMVAVGISLLLGYAISSSLIWPVRRIGQTLDTVAKGGFDARVSVPNRDELGELAHNVNATSEQLGDLYQEVESQRAELAKEHAKSEALLYNLLPADIAARLKLEPDRTIADSLPRVAILFADIVDFTPRAVSLPPEDVVGFLNKIFSAFDELAEKHGLEKVKTIGDAYMVAAGMPSPVGDPVHRVAEMALDMQRVVIEMSSEFPEGLEVRIGLHAGPAVAGVIGSRKLFYDVWGETVNTASRMESLGEPGRIQVTAEVKAELEPGFQFVPRGLVDVKGIGEVETWWLSGKQAAA
ncbi:adenylate/guanylate cyclase domain-containing protein [Falsiruegeria mediterranea]|uniref:Adenylate cyclase n=1 Tax=Falsiruegeria mediterranea M17 TaxID=1200281 RepID=A0A2R8C9R9_9RHOB|nr:adenylate/guanylate cyclase domain-containing protein [Falsiruegeria mediterranea]SPJ29190.1 Adenylate cyclase [Falsiruegeria mediterranea M17]